MPISREDFDAGIDAETKKIIGFLEMNRDKAYTSQEIADNLNMLRSDVIKLLNYLADELEAIDRVVISDRYYYAAKEEE